MSYKWDNMEHGKDKMFKRSKAVGRGVILFTADLLMTCSVFQVAGPVISTSTWDSVPFQLLVPLSYLLLDSIPLWQGSIGRIFLTSGTKAKHKSYVINGSEPSPISPWKEILIFLFLQTNEGEIRQACCGEGDESKNFLMIQSILNALTYVFHWEGGAGAVIE